MKDPFDHDFKQGLDDAQVILGQKFSVGSQTYEAVSIGRLSVADRGMPGGKFQDVSVVMEVRIKIAQQAGLKNDLVITVFGEHVRIIGIEKEGDDSWTVLCGPSGVEIPEL